MSSTTLALQGSYSRAIASYSLMPHMLPRPHAPGRMKALDRLVAVDPEGLKQEALGAVAGAQTLVELDDARVAYLGRKSPLKLALREVRDRESGMALNAAREAIEEAVAERQAVLERADLEERLATERVDVTLPGTPHRRGHLHLVTQVRREVED